MVFDKFKSGVVVLLVFDHLLGGQSFSGGRRIVLFYFMQIYCLMWK